MLPKLGPLLQISHVAATAVLLIDLVISAKSIDGQGARVPREAIRAPIHAWHELADRAARENAHVANLESKVVDVVGDRTAKVLADAFGIKTVGDLMRHYPRRYMVRGELSEISELKEGDEVTILAEVYSSANRPMRGRKSSILEVIVTDGSDKLSLTFFNQAWREKELKVGAQGLFAGKVGLFNSKKQLAHPDYQMVPDGADVDSAVDNFAGKYLPVYPATAKMPSWKISQCIEMAIASLDEVEDYLPQEIRTAHKYPDLQAALVQLHTPIDLNQAELSRERLTFDEAFLLQLLLALHQIVLTVLLPELVGQLHSMHEVLPCAPLREVAIKKLHQKLSADGPDRLLANP